MSSRVLVITSHQDAHIDFVRPHLKSDMLVISPYSWSKNQELSYLHYKQKDVVAWGDKLLSNIHSVWYRKPEVDWRELVDNEYKRYSYSAQITHTEALYSQFSSAIWISDYYAINRASNKPLQLRVAESVGFRVPDTLATASEMAAAQFIKQYPAVIVKSLANIFPAIGDKFLFFPATKVTKGQKINLKGLRSAPAIFQQAVETTADIRVTVIGRKVFSAQVYDTEIGGYPRIRDWRIAHTAGQTHFEAHKLPLALKSQCIHLVDKLGLRFGAIDLVVDKKGHYWFLEINPNGQWAFVEKDTGQPMGRTLARLLASS